MELSFHKIDESHDAVTFEFASPEEFQQYAKAIVPDVPTGYVYGVRKGMSAMKRPTLTLGLTKVGESLRLASDGEASPQANPAPKPVSLDIPDVVKTADDGALETMAVRNHVCTGNVTVEIYRKWSKPRRQAAVAEAMRKQNAG